MINQLWYGASWLRWLLWPLSWLYRLVVMLRVVCYRRGLLASTRLPIPVIVVGNLTVGGTGKTPVVLWLADQLRAAGWRPGIVSRGYRGRATTWPQQVRLDSDPDWVGDEPVLLAQRSGCPVAVGPDRVAAARLILEHCDILIGDDGLQHYPLRRDFEIVVVDGERGLGNGLLLPAGPLREPPGRLAAADFVMINGGSVAVPGSRVVRGELVAGPPYRLASAETRDLHAWRNEQVHAVAGIGHPERFFRMLDRNGLTVIAHPLPDHATIKMEDLSFGDERMVLMTEKDAVKARTLSLSPAWWAVPVDFVLDEPNVKQVMYAIEATVGQPPFKS